MPSGVYPPDHKHEKARGLSRNKFNAKGEPRPQRKTRSKLAKITGSSKTPAEILGERRGLIGYAIDNYDFETNISFKTHLEQLMGDDASLLTEQGKTTAEAFRDDYQQHLKTNVVEPRKQPVLKTKEHHYVEKGMDLTEDAPADMGIPNTIFHKVNKTALNTKINMPTYDIDDPYRIQGADETDVSALLNVKGKARVRAQRADVGVVKGVRLTPYLQTMKNTKEALLKAGKGLSSLKNVMSDAKYNIEGADTDSEDEDYVGPKRYEGRHLDEPFHSIKYEQHKGFAGGRLVPLKDAMSQKFNPRQRKMGVLVNEGDSEDEDFDPEEINVNSTGSVTADYDHSAHELDKGYDIEGGDAIDVNQYKAYALDDFIHGLAFEGKSHPQKEAIMGNLKRGKTFELGFDALLNPFMVTLDEPNKDKGKTIKRLGEESKGITPSILPKTPNYFMDELNKGDNKGVVKNSKAFLQHNGKLYNMDTYNAMRTAEETRQKTFADQPSQDKVYVGDIDPKTGKVRKRAGVKMVTDFGTYDYKTGKNERVRKEFETSASNYNYDGVKYNEEDGLKKGGMYDEIKWKKFNGEKHLVIHIGKRGTNPTASGPLPVAGWSKSKVIHYDKETGEYKKSFRKYHNKQGYYRNFDDTNKGGKRRRVKEV